MTFWLLEERFLVKSFSSKRSPLSVIVWLYSLKKFYKRQTLQPTWDPVVLNDAQLFIEKVKKCLKSRRHAKASDFFESNRKEKWC
ncbi:unnamed protein product [Amoebophrya sp. A120]|nr:unnamed protein product [Amoebophrya sp. A120]|eukprot:GSA120T00020346001.1